MGALFAALVALLISLCAAKVVDDSARLSQLQQKRSWCFKMKEEYSITPGKSFGHLPQELHAQYLNAKCHVFFCKPHPMAGKGVYDCEPLEGGPSAATS